MQRLNCFGFLEHFGSNALAHTADEELVVVPLCDAARKRGVISTLIHPTVAIIRGDPNQSSTSHGGDRQRLARPRILHVEAVVSDRSQAVHWRPGLAAVPCAQWDVTRPGDNHEQGVSDDEVGNAADHSGRCPRSGVPSHAFVEGAVDMAASNTVEGCCARRAVDNIHAAFIMDVLPVVGILRTSA